jgi:hypothetical protein
VRVSRAGGDRVQGPLVESTRDSIEISAVDGVVSLSRDSIEGLELDQRVRRSWLRPFECASAALSGGAIVSAIRSEDTTRAAVSLALTGLQGWTCFRPHVWVRALFPDPAHPASARADSILPSR